MLEAINLSKTYAGGDAEYRVLKNVNLEIRAGECAAIIGKPGSGNSTLPDLLVCLDQPGAGAVRFESANFTTPTEREKDGLRNEHFGFVFRQSSLNGHDAVFENVVLPLRIRGAEN